VSEYSKRITNYMPLLNGRGYRAYFITYLYVLC